MTKRSTETVTQIGEFKLDLPELFNIEALCAVPVSKTYTAFVYRTKIRGAVNDGGPNADQPIMVPGYRVVIRHNKSGRVSPHEDSFQRYGSELVDELEVMLYLKTAAVNHAPKTRTTTERSEDD